MAIGIVFALVCCIPLTLLFGAGIIAAIIIWVMAIYDAATFEVPSSRVLR